MGRITIFTVHDILSHQVKTNLEEHGLPYTEISLDTHPSKIKDAETLSFSKSVPQVFFNTQRIGGVEETAKELKSWDEKCRRQDEIDKKYLNYIEQHPSPADAKFNVPSEEVPLPPSYFRRVLTPAMNIDLSDGTVTTIHDVTERLKSSLPALEQTFNGKVYLSCFTGKSMVDKLSASLNIGEEEAIAFGQHLLDFRIIYNVASSDKKFYNAGGKELYRLQCYRTPDVLNSYCVWRADATVSRAVDVIIGDLHHTLRQIELQSMDKKGKVDMRAARHHRLFPRFEEAVCELQTTDLACMRSEEMLAFGINVYNLMMRYAFLHVGVPTTEVTRMDLLKAVKFNVGGHIFSLQDWLDGVLRGNKKTRFGKKLPFKQDDPRSKFSVKYPDFRAHYAINCGGWVGSSMSVPFTLYTADNVSMELDTAAAVCFEDNRNFKIDSKSGTLFFSRPLMLYCTDFCLKDKEMVSFAEKHLIGNKKLELNQFLAKHENGFNVSFLALDCTRNAANYVEFRRNALDEEVKGFKSLFRQRFRPPEMHPRELERLSTLQSLNILDTMPEERLDRITLMVKNHFEVPIVLISLVDENRQWFKSNQWDCPVPKAEETGRDISFCGHTILGDQNEIFYVEDASKDDRFADNPLVTGDLHLRFYAGCPLSIPDVNNCDEFVNLGTLCLIDQRPRELSLEDMDTVRKFAAEVRREIIRGNGTDSQILANCSVCGAITESKLIEQLPLSRICPPSK